MSVLTYSPEVPAVADRVVDRTPVARWWLAFWGVFVAVTYALLWSPHWYPLSDSSLYLSLGRSVAAGHGLTMMGDPVKLTPPLAPLLIALVIKLGGGIGTIQGTMIGFMLVAHAFCFLALRRLVGERLALAATLAGSMSYWVYANAFTIMSEPPCLASMWAAAWLLTLVETSECPGRRWAKVSGAALLLLAAAASRDAVIVLAPGFLLVMPQAVRPGLKLAAVLAAGTASAAGAWVCWRVGLRRMPPSALWGAAVLVPLGLAALLLAWRRRAAIEAWFDRMHLPAARPEGLARLLVVGGVLGLWLIVYRYPPTFMTSSAVARGPTTMPTTLPGTTLPATLPTFESTPITVAEGDDDSSREGRYKATWLNGVKRDAYHLVTEPPVLAGRWVTEGLAMIAVGGFESRSKVLGGLAKGVGLVAFVLLVVGFVSMVRRGHWWLIGVGLYFAFIWLQWGTRIKPRYMIPITPVLFLLVWAGITAIIARLRKREDALLRWRVAVGLVALVMLGNAFPWWVEFAVRRGDANHFYATARQGAFAELVDIAAWLQDERNAGPHEAVWMNAGAQRRIAYFLSGRRIEVKETPAPTWADWHSTSPTKRFSKPLRNFRRGIPPQDRFMLVFVERPARGVTWPGWHWPLLAPSAPRPNWWKLYTRRGERWVEVPIDHNKTDRSFVRAVPRPGL